MLYGWNVKVIQTGLNTPDFLTNGGDDKSSPLPF